VYSELKLYLQRTKQFNTYVLVTAAYTHRVNNTSYIIIYIIQQLIFKSLCLLILVTDDNVYAIMQILYSSSLSSGQ